MRFLYSGSFNKNNKDYTIASDCSARFGSMTQSNSNLIPPDQAHCYGFPIASFLTISIDGALYCSSVDSANATRELASNLGNVLGAASIHLLTNFNA